MNITHKVGKGSLDQSCILQVFRPQVLDDLEPNLPRNLWDIGAGVLHRRVHGISVVDAGIDLNVRIRYGFIRISCQIVLIAEEESRFYCESDNRKSMRRSDCAPTLETLFDRDKLGVAAARTQSDDVNN